MIKKYILYSFFQLLLISSYAQSFEISNFDDRVFLNGDTYLLQGGYHQHFEAWFNVSNTSNSTVELGIKRYAIDICEETSNTICFGGCYQPNEDYFFEGDIVVSIPPNTMSTDPLVGHYYSSDNNCCSKILYTVYDVNNPNDSIGIYVIYYIKTPDYCTTDIEDINNTSELSLPYPIPADKTVSFDINLKNDALIQVINIVGNEVAKIAIKPSDSHISFSVEEWKSGLYFYNIIEKNRIIYKNKIIIQH